MWAAQFYKYKEGRQLITSGGLGTMGYGLGASLGAKVARPDKLVFNIAGDGCFRMNMNEIATAARYNIRSSRLLSTIMYSEWYASGRHFSTDSVILIQP